MPNLSKFEAARAAGQALNQAKITVQVRRNEIKAAQIEARQVFGLAQADPLVAGAFEARNRLRQIEADLPEKTGGLPELEAVIERASRQARAAGLDLYTETEALLETIEAKLRQEILPLVEELHAHADVLRACYVPLPGQNGGRHDPFSQLPTYLQGLKPQLDFIEIKAKAKARG